MQCFVQLDSVLRVTKEARRRRENNFPEGEMVSPDPMGESKSERKRKLMLAEKRQWCARVREKEKPTDSLVDFLVLLVRQKRPCKCRTKGRMRTLQQH